MNKTVLIFILSIACKISFAAGSEANSSHEPAEHVRERADALMRNWRTVTVDIIKDPANAEALQRLRVEAKAPHRDDARVPLLRIGDPEVITQCMTEFRTKKSGRRDAARQLKLSANPAVIALVADDLFRDESTEAEWITPEFRERPVSVYAGDIICEIIRSSSEFSGATKQWAVSLSKQPYQRREAVRYEMRRWWTENRDSLQAKRYHEVKPPTNSSK
jgi:hypothetical protein